MFSQAGTNTGRGEGNEMPYSKGLDPGDDMSLINKDMQVYKYYPK
jgi:hypothetical protein